MDDTSPTSRALLTLELLQGRPGITADQLAQRLDVTERAARRYVAILREAGIPVESERGPYGGYRLGRGVRLPPLSFGADEALALVMAVLEASVPHPDDALTRAVAKILRALPADVAAQAATVRDQAAVSSPRWSARPDPAFTAQLASAAARHQRVHLGYRTEGGRAIETDVDPWAVVVRRGVWYPLCHAHVANDVRTYRVDRVAECRDLDERFVPPPDLDPAALLEQHLGTGWEHPTRVVFDVPLEQMVHWIGGATSRMGRLTALDDDHCLLVGSTSNAQMYAGEWLAALPVDFRVEGGDELRAAVSALADRLGRAGRTIEAT